ncbi:MAG: YtxH domain-containing protein [Candidatus Saganbacteria bacterium]|nr:YtxH domain-containing protein [Candidatus Saganbacteria bacterium]
MARLFRTLTIGGIIGFIAGLLFAPKRGEETRKDLKDSLDKGKERFEELKEEFSRKEEE